MRFESTVRFPSLDGTPLEGKLFEGDRRRAVLLVHGISGDKDEQAGYYGDLAAFLHERGATTLRFDLRGHGENTTPSTEFTISGATLDVRAAIRLLLRKGSARISIVGTSFGAGPTAFAACHHRKEVDRIVLVCPVIDYRRTFLEPESPWSHQNFSPAKIKELEETGVLYLGGQFALGPKLFEEFAYFDVTKALRTLGRPTLVIHGDRDIVIPYDTSAVLARRLAKIVKLKRLRGADHVYIEFGDASRMSPQSIKNKVYVIHQAAKFLGLAKARPLTERA